MSQQFAEDAEYSRNALTAIWPLCFVARSLSNEFLGYQSDPHLANVLHGLGGDGSSGSPEGCI